MEVGVVVISRILQIGYKDIELTSLGIKNPAEDLFYYEIWKVQVAGCAGPNPQIILFCSNIKIIIVYDDLSTFEKHLNYILESMAED